MRRAEKEYKSPDVIGPQRYLQFPQNFRGFLNPPAEFLQREKRADFYHAFSKTASFTTVQRALHPDNTLKNASTSPLTALK